MSAVAKPLLTEEEYLRRERAAEFKSEFYRGEMFAMAGAKRPHNLLSSALVRLIGNALADRNCEVYSHDMRVKVTATGLYTYPDVIVVCGQPQFVDDEFDTLLNPKVLIEVLSESTASYDRGTKRQQYQEIPSLQEYVVVAQDAPSIEVFRRRGEEGWLVQDAKSLEASLTLESFDIAIPLAEIYRQVEFPPPRLRPSSG